MNVILAVHENSGPALDAMRRERKELLERAAALSRQIATTEAMEILGQEHADAEANGVPAVVEKPAPEKPGPDGAREKKSSPRNAED